MQNVCGLLAEREAFRSAAHAERLMNDSCVHVLVKYVGRNTVPVYRQSDRYILLVR